MCGIAGFLDFRRRLGADELVFRCGAMTDAIAHRGPDDRGTWCDAHSGIALGHRRLSIVDLSPLGHQPMASANGRFVITYNGEIYNFEELRTRLGPYSYRGRSDTEVVLAAFEAWGIEEALKRFDGMFALAVWDTQEHALYLARDRFGEKPLYYGRCGDYLLFGSELNALRAHPAFDTTLDLGSLAQLLRYAYVPTPRSIFSNFKKLPPASFVRISEADGALAGPTAYWEYTAVVRQGRARQLSGSAEEAIDDLDGLLRRVVTSRLMSDVPVGAFLSGGIDSTCVVTMLQAQRATRQRTFTIGFDETQYNEAHSAKHIAAHLGTDHTELYVSSEQAQRIIPELPAIYDEPFADSSQIPTALVARLARERVAVALSGDGGDELFGGYNRYVWAPRIWKRLEKLPLSARQHLSGLLRRFRPRTVDSAVATASALLGERFNVRTPGDKLRKIAGTLLAPTARDLYLDLVSTWKDTSVVLGAAEPAHPVLHARHGSSGSFAEEMMCMDALTYLPDDILTKVDRASMSIGLETRVPFLSGDVAAFAWALPLSFKIREGRGKWILRELLARYLPRHLFERPKMGFGVPIDSWLRGPLRPWAEEALNEQTLRSQGYLDPVPIRLLWAEHLSGRQNHQNALWNVLMFQGWLEAGRSRPGA